MTKEQLREWRIKRQMTQPEAAAIFLLDERTWRRWENGERALNPLLPWALMAYDLGVRPPVLRDLRKKKTR